MEEGRRDTRAGFTADSVPPVSRGGKSLPSSRALPHCSTLRSPPCSWMCAPRTRWSGGRWPRMWRHWRGTRSIRHVSSSRATTERCSASMHARCDRLGAGQWERRMHNRSSRNWHACCVWEWCGSGRSLGTGSSSGVAVSCWLGLRRLGHYQHRHPRIGASDHRAPVPSRCSPWRRTRRQRARCPSAPLSLACSSRRRQTKRRVWVGHVDAMSWWEERGRRNESVYGLDAVLLPCCCSRCPPLHCMGTGV